MLKNDRIMSVLTIVAIICAVGPFTLRLGFLESYIGAGTAALELRRDQVIVPVNSLTGMDVLANDLGLSDGDADNLIITKQPKCGRVFARDKQAQYQPSEHCVGSQSFSYTIHGRSPRQTGEVTVVVRLDAPTPSPVALAQHDTTVPTAVEPRAPVAHATATPLLLATEAAAVTVSAVIQPPAVPRPQTPVIATLLDTTSAAGAADGAADGPMAAGVAQDGLGLPPKMTTPPAGLAERTVVVTAPVVLRSAGPGTVSEGTQSSHPGKLGALDHGARTGPAPTTHATAASSLNVAADAGSAFRDVSVPAPVAAPVAGPETADSETAIRPICCFGS